MLLVTATHLLKDEKASHRSSTLLCLRDWPLRACTFWQSQGIVPHRIRGTLLGSHCRSIHPAMPLLCPIDGEVVARQLSTPEPYIESISWHLSHRLPSTLTPSTVFRPRSTPGPQGLRSASSRSRGLAAVDHTLASVVSLERSSSTIGLMLSPTPGIASTESMTMSRHPLRWWGMKPTVPDGCHPRMCRPWLSCIGGFMRHAFVSLCWDRHDGGPFLATGSTSEDEHQEREQPLGGHVVIINGKPVAAIAHDRERHRDAPPSCRCGSRAWWPFDIRLVRRRRSHPAR